MSVCFSGDYTPIEYFDTGFDQHLGRFAPESMRVRRAGPTQVSKDWGYGVPLHRPVSVEEVDLGEIPF